MNKICFINGSPKFKGSMSEFLIEEIEKTIDKTKFTIKKLHINDILKDNTKLGNIKDTTKLVFVSPLYVDTVPGNLMEGLIKIEKYIKLNNINSIDVYTVFNCGFLEGEQNNIALDVIKNFCNRANLVYKFGVGTGAGVFMNNSRTMPLHFGIKKPIYKSIMTLSYDIQEKEKYSGANLLVNPSINRSLFKVMASGFWISISRKNKIKIKDMNNTPYNI